MERQLTHLRRGDDSTGVQLASGSRITSPDAAVLRKRLEYVTMQCGHGHPSTAHLDMLSSGRHSVVQARRSPSPKIRRRVARRRDDDRDSLIAGRSDDAAEVVEVRAVNKHSLSTSASGRKCYAESEVAESPCSSDKVVSKRSVVLNRVVSDKSGESDSDACVCSRKLCHDKLKSACVSDKSGNVEHVLCARSKSDRPSSMSVVTKRKSCGKSRVTRVSDDSHSADRKSVSRRASRVPEGKANVSKSSRESRHRHRREESVECCSGSESDTDKRHTFTRRRSFIRPDRSDGATPSFATFKAHFENAAQFNRWRESEQLAHLKASLVGAAYQCLWDQSPECVNTLDKLWKLLSDRFAGQNLTEKFRTELRNRRRKLNESLDALCTDVRRLLIMGYPGLTSSAHEAIAKDSFIGALDSELAQKVRERDPGTLDEALHTALRLETIREAAAVSVHGVTDDHVRYKNRHARGINTGTDQSAIS